MNARRLLFPQVRQVEWEDFTLSLPPEPNTVVAQANRSLVSVGTELALYTGTHIGFTLPKPPFPMMPQRPGYAFVGRVIAAGANVEQLQPGQRVMMEAPHGFYAALDITTGTVVPLPDELGDAEATLIRMADIALTTVRVAPLQLGDPVVIFGLGLVGQLAGQLYRLHGGHPVIGIDRIPARLEIAAANGLLALNADEADIPAEVARLSGGRAPQVVVEATGSPAVVQLALELVARGGRVTLLGSTRGRIDLDVYSLIHRKGVQLIGAHESAINLDTQPVRRWTKGRDLRLLAELLAEGRLKSQGLISHTIQPGELPAMYEKLAAQPEDYLGVCVDWTLDK